MEQGRWEESRAANALQASDSAWSWASRILNWPMFLSIVTAASSWAMGWWQRLPWQERGFFALASAVVVFAAVEIWRQRRSAVIKRVQRDADARVRDRFTEWQAEKKGLEQASARLIESEKSSVLAKIDDLQERLQAELSGHAATKAEAKNAKDMVCYGASLPEVSPVDEPTRAAMMHGLQKLKPRLVAVENTSGAIWQRIKAESCRQPEFSPIGWLRVNVEEYEYRYMQNAANDLARQLANSRDPRAILARWYVTYRDWRVSLGRLAATLGWQLIEMPGYRDWRAAEIALAEAFKTELAPDALKVVHEAVQMCDNMHGKLSEPPPLHTTAEFGQFGGMVRRLASATPEENRFLGLFCDIGPAMIPGDEKTYLESSAHRGGHALLQYGLLTMRFDEQKREIFSLPDLAYRAWMASERVQPKTKTITIDLASVSGTGSSGGGAPARGYVATTNSTPTSLRSDPSSEAPLST